MLGGDGVDDSLARHCVEGVAEVHRNCDGIRVVVHSGSKCVADALAPPSKSNSELERSHGQASLRNRGHRGQAGQPVEDLADGNGPDAPIPRLLQGDKGGVVEFLNHRHFAREDIVHECQKVICALRVSLNGGTDMFVSPSANACGGTSWQTSKDRDKPLTGEGDWLGMNFWEGGGILRRVKLLEFVDDFGGGCGDWQLLKNFGCPRDTAQGELMVELRSGSAVVVGAAGRELGTLVSVSILASQQAGYARPTTATSATRRALVSEDLGG